MKLFKELLVSVAIVAVFFLLMGVVLPSKRHIEETVDTNRNTTVVYDMLNGFGRFKDWNAVFMRDPAAQYKISGPAEGKGAKIEYTSKVREVGKGSWTITGNEAGKRIEVSDEAAELALRHGWAQEAPADEPEQEPPADETED